MYIFVILLLYTMVAVHTHTCISNSNWKERWEIGIRERKTWRGRNRASSSTYSIKHAYILLYTTNQSQLYLASAPFSGGRRKVCAGPVCFANTVAILTPNIKSDQPCILKLRLFGNVYMLVIFHADKFITWRL